MVELGEQSRQNSSIGTSPMSPEPSRSGNVASGRGFPFGVWAGLDGDAITEAGVGRRGPLSTDSSWATRRESNRSDRNLVADVEPGLVNEATVQSQTVMTAEVANHHPIVGKRQTTMAT